MSLEFLKNLAQEYAGRVAIDDGTTAVTYAELATAVNALAVALQMKDPAPGSRVGLCAANSLEYLVSVLAINAAGKVLLPMNCYGNTVELHEILNTSHPATIIVDDLGDQLILSESELKIHFSQLPGLVATYRDHVPETQQTPVQ
ncbi:MAG TPA: class I adenylate-forming enzyme family protein [Candidimonas sp.]|nr:class I adenylate-forming enzyme family protein [Candidimonas sp.]